MKKGDFENTVIEDNGALRSKHQGYASIDITAEDSEDTEPVCNYASFPTIGEENLYLTLHSRTLIWMSLRANSYFTLLA